MTSDQKHLTDREKRVAAKAVEQLQKIEERRARRQARAESAEYRLLERTLAGIKTVLLWELSAAQQRALCDAESALLTLAAPFTKAKDDKTPKLPFGGEKE